jgi:gluconolactonase
MMWNLIADSPTIIEARVLSTMPHELRRPVASEWADANKAGAPVDSFIEGPSFDRAGNLYLADIPHGRILRVDPSLRWSVVAEYDGWPNGTAFHRDGSLWIADYRRGLLRLDVSSGEVRPLLGHRNSESFKGLNDLTFDGQGRCYFTDQGQTGMHDPTGRVFRWNPDNGQLDCLLSTAPSPNGVVLDMHEKALFVAVTRGNAVWRGPLQRDGSLSKLGVFRSFYGTSGPDGLALDSDNRLVVAHASLSAAFVIDSRGEVSHIVRSPAGSTLTNVAFRPGTRDLVMTESQTGTLLTATLPGTGALLFSHAS